MGHTRFGTHLAPSSVTYTSVCYTRLEISSILFGAFIIKCQVTYIVDITVSHTE
jgi:hypothetical protein